jgi:hypothetical protein
MGKFLISGKNVLYSIQNKNKRLATIKGGKMKFGLMLPNKGRPYGDANLLV